jgi:hypothetical protein
MPMRVAANQVGDIVEVDRLGRRFHPLVAGNVSGDVSIPAAAPAHQLQDLPSP